jgi:hypothetical protein
LLAQFGINGQHFRDRDSGGGSGTHMVFSPGDKVGPYESVEPIGEGGGVGARDAPREKNDYFA